MRKKALFIGAIIWGLVALVLLAIFVLGMTGRFEIPGLSSGRLLQIGAAADLIKTETFSLKDIDSLEISSAYSDISINLVSGDQMTVRQYDVDMANQFTSVVGGKNLAIEIEPRNIRVSFAISYWPRLEIDLPAEYADAVSLRSSSGTIRCPDTAPSWADTTISTNSGTIRFDTGISCGDLKISSSSGTVHMGDISAGQLEIETNSGSHRLGEIRARDLARLKSGSGTINTGEIYSAELQVEANSGTVRLDDLDIGGAVNINTGSGSINTDSLRGESVDVETNSGTIRMGDIEASGRVYMKSGSGSHNIGDVVCGSYEISANSGTLNYDGVSGSGKIKSGSGSIKCEDLDVRGDCSIESNSGTVRIGLADRANFEITISSNSGSIRTGDYDLFFKGQYSKEAFGTIGDGSDGTLSISTGSGSVYIDDD